MKSKLKLLFLLSLLLGACASQPPAGTIEAPLTAGTPENPDAAESSESPLDPTSPDVMYRVFAGEVMGVEGDMEQAASEYLEAAMESDDPAIAARATRIAISAQAWQHAAMAADRWALLQPDNIDARQTAARTMMMVGDYVGAEHQLNGIIAQMPHDQARAWALVTGLLISSGAPDKSAKVMDHLILDNKAEQNPDALFAKSQFLARQGDLDQAAELVSSAIELSPERAEFLAWAGRIAVNQAQLERALEYYNAAWKLQPENQGMSMAYAELLKRTGKIDEAQEVLALLADDPGTRFARIAFAIDSGRPELAASIYREFEQLSYPDEMEHAFQAAQAAELLSLPAEAAAWYEKVDQGERMIVAALRRAYLTAEVGDVEGARKQLSRLRRQDDPVIVKESFLAESEILMDAGKPAEAFELLTDSLREIPADTQLLYGRAMVAVELNNIEDAEQDLRQIIEKEPQNAPALNALGYTLADRSQRYEEAESLILAAYALQPDEASIIDSMGWVSFRLGRLQDAEKFLRNAWMLNDNAEIAAHLGEVLWVAEQHEEALGVWRKAYKSDPANAVLNETMERFGIKP